MAIRQLNYCPHCGMPLFRRGGDPVYFCQNCGHGLAGLNAPVGSSGALRGASGGSSGASGSAGAVRPSLVLVAHLPHHAGLVRRVAAAGLDLFLGALA
ncbi:MAG TPA: Sjogren's syndrome/scleroderma autoantigen 1 family protein, partial [Actinomycetota bacterium]